MDIRTQASGLLWFKRSEHGSWRVDFPYNSREAVFIFQVIGFKNLGFRSLDIRVAAVGVELEPEGRRYRERTPNRPIEAMRDPYIQSVAPL